MKVHYIAADHAFSLRGIKIDNADYEEICNVTWATASNEGYWVYCDVPVGQQVVGCQIGHWKNSISRLDFKLANMHSSDPAPIPDFIPSVITSTIEFGDPKGKFDTRWDDLSAFKKPSKLIGIKYRHSGDEMNGFQLIWQNAVKT